MTCEQASQQSTDYLEGAVSIAQRWSYRAHVATCRNCRAEVRQLRLTVTLLRRVGPPPVSEPARADVMAVFRRWQPADAGSAVPRLAATARFASALDRLFRGGRGWLALALVVLGSLGLAALIRPVPGAREPAIAGLECMAIEMLAGLLPLVAVGALAWQARRAVSAKTFAVTAALGALVGQSAIHLSCPEAGLHIHAAFHVAGVLGAVLLGVIATLVETALLSPNRRSRRA